MRASYQARILSGLSANVVSQIAFAAIQICSVPIFLHAWGKTQYGEWLLLTAVPAYLALCDLGFSSIAGTQMTMQVARGDFSGAIATFHSAILLVCNCCAVLILLVLATLHFAPAALWSNFHFLMEQDIRDILLLISAYVLLGLPNELIAAALRSDGHYALSSYLATAVRVFEFILVTFALAYDASAATVGWLYLAARLLGFFALSGVMRHVLPWLAFDTKQADRKIARRMAPSALAYLGFPLGNALNLQGMVLIIGSLTGPAQVAVFVTFRTVTRSVSQFMAIINNSFSPEISRAYGAGDHAALRDIYAKACRASLTLSTVVISLLFLIGDPLVKIWTNGRVESNFALLAALLVSAALNSIWFTASIILAATNKHQRLAATYVAGTFLGLVLAFCVIPAYGLVGAAIAQSFVEIAMIAYVLISISRIFKVQ